MGYYYSTATGANVLAEVTGTTRPVTTEAAVLAGVTGTTGAW